MLAKAFAEFFLTQCSNSLYLLGLLIINIDINLFFFVYCAYYCIVYNPKCGIHVIYYFFISGNMEHALDFDFFEDRYPKRIRKPINKVAHFVRIVFIFFLFFFLLARSERRPRR